MTLYNNILFDYLFDICKTIWLFFFGFLLTYLTKMKKNRCTDYFSCNIQALELVRNSLKGPVANDDVTTRREWWKTTKDTSTCCWRQFALAILSQACIFIWCCGQSNIASCHWQEWRNHFIDHIYSGTNLLPSAVKKEALKTNVGIKIYKF